MDLSHLIHHPEDLNKDTLFELRSLVALYPYYQTARLLLLQNLYLLHDPTFDEELRSAAIHITDRKTLFNLIEAAHHQIGKRPTVPAEKKEVASAFTEPKEEPRQQRKRKPTPADATIDYVAYLLENEEESTSHEQPQMKGQNLIDNFINKEGGKIKLKEQPEYTPQIDDTKDGKNSEENYFTETLAKIYIKQGRYSKALEIIKQLNLNYPKKNAYFADQIRFLEKLIINNK